MSFAPQFRHFALAGICAAGWLSIPWQVYERRAEIAAYVQTILPAPANRSSPYLVAPGNRTPCDMWIAHQSDSSRAKWVVKCVGVKA